MQKIFGVFVALFALAVLIFAGHASAQSFHTGTNVNINEDIINATLFAAGSTVDINSEVSGDVYCAGQTVTISGTVRGDVLCAAQTLTVNGVVDGDVRLAGQSVTLNATVAGNASIAGQTFSLPSGSEIKGDLTLGATSATLNGNIGRDIIVGSENFIVAGTVGRNIRGAVENIRLTRNSSVGGLIEYTSNTDLIQEDGAVVAGEIVRTKPQVQSANNKRGAVFGFSVAWFLYWFAAMLLTALVLVLLFPRLFDQITRRALPFPWKAALTGFVAGIAVPILSLFMLVSVVGIPLFMLLMLVWLTIILMSGPVFSFYLGRLVWRNGQHAVPVMLIGASILIVVYFIPIIGILAMLLALMTGSGMILIDLFYRMAKPDYAIKAPQTVKSK